MIPAAPAGMGAPSGRQLPRIPARQFPGLHPAPRWDSLGPLPDSPRVSHRWPRMVRGRCAEPESNHRIGNGGQGRNRTIDTRIFSSSESAVRCEKAEEAERVSAATTELPSPTEPIPNPRGRARPSRAVSSRNARASPHRDRTRTEPRAERAAPECGTPHPRPQSRSRDLSDDTTRPARSADF